MDNLTYEKHLISKAAAPTPRLTAVSSFSPYAI